MPIFEQEVPNLGYMIPERVLSKYIKARLAMIDAEKPNDVTIRSIFAWQFPVGIKNERSYLDIRKWFDSADIKIMHGHPTIFTALPRIVFPPGQETQRTSYVGNMVSIEQREFTAIEEPLIEWSAEFESALHPEIQGYGPDETGWLYHIIFAILIAGRVELEGLGLRSMTISGSPGEYAFPPDKPEDMPPLLMAHRMNINVVFSRSYLQSEPLENIQLIESVSSEYTG